MAVPADRMTSIYHPVYSHELELHIRDKFAKITCVRSQVNFHFVRPRRSYATVVVDNVEWNTAVRSEPTGTTHIHTSLILTFAGWHWQRSPWHIGYPVHRTVYMYDTLQWFAIAADHRSAAETVRTVPHRVCYAKRPHHTIFPCFETSSYQLTMVRK